MGKYCNNTMIFIPLLVPIIQEKSRILFFVEAVICIEYFPERIEETVCKAIGTPRYQIH